MWQLFKPLTGKQYAESELRNRLQFERDLANEQDKLNRMMYANKIMIQQLTKELEKMK